MARKAKTRRRILARIDELIDSFSGRLDSGGDLRRQVERLRSEWR